MRVSGQASRRNSTHYLALGEPFVTGGYAPRIVPRSFIPRTVSIVRSPFPPPRHFRRLTTPSSAWEVSITQSWSEPQPRDQTPASVREGVSRHWAPTTATAVGESETGPISPPRRSFPRAFRGTS